MGDAWVYDRTGFYYSPKVRYFSAVGGVVSTPGDTTTVTPAETDGARTTSGVTYRTFDYAPSVKQFAKMVTEDYDNNNVRTQRDVETLVSFKPAP